jgi:hypothetical protein
MTDLFGLFPRVLLEKWNLKFVRRIFDEDGIIKGADPVVRMLFDRWIKRVE